MECYNQANSIVLLLKYHNNSYKCGHTMRFIASGSETKSHCLFTHIKLNIFFPPFFFRFIRCNQIYFNRIFRSINLFSNTFCHLVICGVVVIFLIFRYKYCWALCSVLLCFAICACVQCTVHAPVLFGWFKVWLNLLTIGFNTYIDYIALYFM